MTARPSVPAIALNTDPVTIKQDYSTNGPLIVAQDDSQLFRVSVKGPNVGDDASADGIVRDARVTKNNELTVSPNDSVIYDKVYNVRANVVEHPLGVIPAEGFTSATIVYSVQPSNGMLFQISLDGANWYNTISSAYTSAFSAAQYTANYPYTLSIPPCKFIRLYFLHNSAAQIRFTLALSKSPRVEHVVAKIQDLITDSSTTVQAATTAIPALTVGSPDASKRIRPLSADGSVNQRGQTATYSYGSAYAPYYANVLATAISRPDAASYKYDQPAALQTNDRGHLKTESEEMRRNQELQILKSQELYMQSLDPNRGFELR